MDMTAIPHFLEIGIETVSMYAMEKSTVKKGKPVVHTHRVAGS
jgi:hypothetical protein